MRDVFPAEHYLLTHLMEHVSEMSKSKFSASHYKEYGIFDRILVFIKITYFIYKASALASPLTLSVNWDVTK